MIFATDPDPKHRVPDTGTPIYDDVVAERGVPGQDQTVPQPSFASDEVRTWRHDRKGVVRGGLLRDDGTWLTVRLAGDHNLYYKSEANRGKTDPDGTVLQFRKSHMSESEVAA